jgi:hypothetical protein
VGRNTPRLDIEGPSHELRVFVDTSGNITGLETVRVRSQKAMFVPKSDYGLGRRIAVSDPKHSRLRAALSERVPEVRISLYESPSGARGRVRGRVLANSFGDAGWDFSGYPAGWNPDTDPMTDTDREAFIDYYVAEYDYQANAWLEEIDLEEGTGLEQVRSNASLLGPANPVPSGTASIGDNCIDQVENLFAARLAIVGATARAVYEVGSIAVAVSSGPGAPLVYTAARVFVRKALEGLATQAAAGLGGILMKRQLNRCRQNELV